MLSFFVLGLEVPSVLGSEFECLPTDILSYFEIVDIVSYIGTTKLGKYLPRYCISLKDTANVSTGGKKRKEYKR